ncbi:MAG: hypothetical protein HOI34_07980 [Rhodospirillaceae bacterium]|nr:hypothetical protein [Rhodospirillaceae bacterium]MBT6510242.1 hypothetical protein [Rhodospirillaceae bacterium]MBT7613760.1 hypothetical protein [Rhodospirillaceae bacterium]MBT7648588.1 hypothetical protein [Rhodospirillaceae bacterium]
MCARRDGAAVDDRNDYGDRVQRAADEFEAIQGLRPETPCGTTPEMAALGSCNERYDGCIIGMENEAGFCSEECRRLDCSVACSGGSYDQCDSCMTSCSRRCNRAAAQSYDQCSVDLDVCTSDESGG